MFFGSSLPCHGLVCSVLLWHFLTILPYFWLKNHFCRTKICNHLARDKIVGCFTLIASWCHVTFSVLCLFLTTPGLACCVLIWLCLICFRLNLNWLLNVWINVSTCLCRLLTFNGVVVCRTYCINTLTQDLNNKIYVRLTCLMSGLLLIWHTSAKFSVVVDRLHVWIHNLSQTDASEHLQIAVHCPW